MTVINPSSITGISSVTSLTTTPIKFYDSSGTETLGDVSVTSINSGPLAGSRNRIINGDMRIDQRNAGVSTTVGNTNVTGSYGGYCLDRWSVQSYSVGSSTGFAFSVIRSGTVPVGFTSSVLLTTTTNKTNLESTDASNFSQPIEGVNFSDLSWGTSSAKPITLSFWVRSSLTGTFGGSIRNSAQNPVTRSYPFPYTINSANTWEYKTITIPGDTTGTWPTDNTLGVSITFSLGSGSNYSGTANTWLSGNIYQPTGSVSLVSTASATLYITGVQVEAGTVATPFERRPFGQELALCQRYYEKSYNVDVAPGTNTSVGSYYAYGTTDQTSKMGCMIPFKQTKRTTPSTITYYTSSGTSGSWGYDRSAASSTVTIGTGGADGTNSTLAYTASVGAAWTNTVIYGHWVVSAEL